MGAFRSEEQTGGRELTRGGKKQDARLSQPARGTPPRRVSQRGRPVQGLVWARGSAIELS